VQREQLAWSKATHERNDDRGFQRMPVKRDK
jgi:hypothetical protein